MVEQEQVDDFVEASLMTVDRLDAGLRALRLGPAPLPTTTPWDEHVTTSDDR